MAPRRQRIARGSTRSVSHGWNMPSSSSSAYLCYGLGTYPLHTPYIHPSPTSKEIALLPSQQEHVPRRLPLLPAPLPHLDPPPRRLPLRPHLRLLPHKPPLHAPPHPPPIPGQLPQPHHPLPPLQHRSLHPPRPLNRHLPLRLPRPLLRLPHGHRLHRQPGNRTVPKRRLRIRI